MFSLQKIFLEFPGKILFDHISLLINERDRVGLAGRNGAGKSTLLKIMSGLEKSYKGTLVFPKEKSVGYLVQERSFQGKDTVFNEALKAFAELNEWRKKAEATGIEIATREDFESDSYLELAEKLHFINERISLLENIYNEASVEKVLKGLGFSREDFDRPLSEFSGGWQMRVELAKLLLSKPDLLLLDEPTNHLDIDSIQWLESYLKDYPGAIVLVSHDRILLDHISTRTIEIEFGKIYDYPASYSTYLTLRKERLEQMLAEKKNQEKEIQANEALIERFRYKASKAKMVQSRIKMLEKMDRIEIEDTDTSSINFRFRPASESGKIVLEAQNASKTYGSHLVFGNTDFIIAKNERIAFVGKNGEGKSTLVKMIMGKIDFDGTIKTGHNVQIGYFAQNQIENLDQKLTVYETLEDVADAEIRPRLRGILGNFLFSGEDIDKKVSVLSGGEKTRLALARMLLQPVNFLILDEPTNHLDMAAKDVLKQALLHFNGTLIIVSHDRHFLSGLSMRIFEFRQKKIIQHHFNIEELLEFNENRIIEEEKQQNSIGGEKSQSENKQKYLEKKERDRQIRKLEKDIHQCEERIATLESELVILEQKLSNADMISANENFDDISIQYAVTSEKLNDLLQEWEKLHDALSKL